MFKGLSRLNKLEEEQRKENKRKAQQKKLNDNFYNDTTGYKTKITYKTKIIIVDDNTFKKKKKCKSHHIPKPKKERVVIMPDSHKDMDHKSKEYKRMYHYLYHKKNFDESQRKLQKTLEMSEEELINHKNKLLEKNMENKKNKYGTMYHYRLMNRMRIDNEVRNGNRELAPSKQLQKQRMRIKYRFKRCMYQIRGEDFNKSQYTPQRQQYAKTKGRQRTLRKKLIKELNMLINNIDNIQSLLKCRQLDKIQNS